VITVDRPHSDAKLLCDLRPGSTLLAQRGYPADIYDNLRTSE
jgi:hypothetical protein